ncbi:membrane protein (plasmid) [Rhizobium leguminosarum bv. trifolii CB782]|nr:membrane protein [Rhizobium leguminosarum bv. trifolii CB782]
MFTSVDQCVASGMDRQVCQASYQDAMRAHLATAPRFNGMAACEAEYGSGHCTEQPANTVPNNTGGSGSFFMPFLAGYMLSSALNNIGDYNDYRQRQVDSGYYYGSTPIYRNRSGQTVTTTVRSGGTGNDALTAPSRQSVKPVNVNTRTVARQGFGGRSSFSFGG